MGGGVVVALLLAGLLGLGGRAQAAEWGAIVPGESTMDVVQARYGPATRTVAQKVEGYDSLQWIYEGAQAPGGIKRMAVDFGLLTPAGYRREIVRVLRLEPKRGIFTRVLVLRAWGEPTRFTPDGHVPPSLYYDSGLLVTFDKEGEQAESLVFTPPQPAAGPGERRP